VKKVVKNMKNRYINNALALALSDTPVVLLHGPRQAGKSTLAQGVAEKSATYFTFDDLTTLSMAQADPEEFLASVPGRIIIDEVARVPNIFLAIKRSVDLKREPGRFLLTGSANILLLPQLADSLAGRMEIIPLFPFSQTEILQTAINFVENAFSHESFAVPSLLDIDIWKCATLGGYPEILNRRNDQRRSVWFESYVTSIVLKDIRDISHVSAVRELPKLLNILAARAASLLNYANVAADAQLPQTSVKNYIALFETTFLITLLLPWSTNINKRFVKAPKVMLNDTGLLAHLLGMDNINLSKQHPQRGKLLENFVFTELYKQSTWSHVRCKLFHFRTHAGVEVDFLLEASDKRIVGIEVKSSGSVTASDFKGLQQLAEMVPDQFHRGIILYTGDKVIPFGKKLVALPMQALFC
jgi:uncharacterized protein